MHIVEIVVIIKPCALEPIQVIGQDMSKAPLAAWPSQTDRILLRNVLVCTYCIEMLSSTYPLRLTHPRKPE